MFPHAALLGGIERPLEWPLAVDDNVSAWSANMGSDVLLDTLPPTTLRIFRGCLLGP
jgi:hypothetical protein